MHIRSGFVKKIRDDRSEGYSILKKVMISAATIVFFVLVIVFYYYLLYSDKRESILRDGQVSAMQTKGQVEDYLSTCIEAVELTSYTLDKMVADDESSSEILQYLTGQTAAVISSIFENTTGIYAFVRGEDYVDGSGWIPGKDYDASTRPWYVNAIKNNAEVTLIDPYMDADTHTIMMSIAKGLKDGKSVVSMDISLERIQKITEEAVKDSTSDYELILDSRNMVVAHSDPSQIGKEYSKEVGTVWAALMEKCGKSQEDVFEFSYSGSKYIVYSMELLSGWHCLYVKDATSFFAPLQFMGAATLAVGFVIVSILAYIMYTSIKRFGEAVKLNKQLDSIANTFFCMYDIDLLDDSFSIIKTTFPIPTDNPQNIVYNARSTLNGITGEVTADISKVDIFRFMDFDTLNERLKDIDTIAEEFLSVYSQWLRARFVVARRKPDGCLHHVMFVVEGIHEEKTRRDQLIEMSEKAEAANRAKSAFLSNMSHEIRTPINAVLGMNEIILRESSEPNVIEYSQSIKSSGNTLLGLINDILDFSKIESGKLDIIPVEYDLSSTLIDLDNMIRSRAQSKGLSLELNFNKDVPRHLFGDEVRIKQIITNILTNAVKYTEHGGIIFSVDYDECAADPESIMLKVSVKDTGIGIRPEDMEKLFSKYERIEEQRNRNIEGTGLGMSITKSLLEMMGSHLMVESEYGVGSTFYFSLRQKVRGKEILGDYSAVYEETMKTHMEYKEKFTAPTARVLVVDDNNMNLIVFRQLLKQTEVMIDTAGSGDEGIALADKEKYDIIFLDHMMPEKDGIETLRELKADKDNLNQDTPFICLTANAISGAREKYLESGFNDYMTKPIDPELLERVLMEYLPQDKIHTFKAEADESEVKELPQELITLRETAGIDIEEGLRNNGTSDVYISLLEIFYESMDEKVAELTEFYNTENFYDYTVKVHALKSSAKIVGAMELADQALQLELAGKEDNIDFIRDNHDKLMEEISRLKQPLSDMFEKSDQAVLLASDDLMEVAYMQLSNAASDRDQEMLDIIIRDMGDYVIPDNEAGKWEQVTKSVEERDYERILRIVSGADTE